jgi:hypothetical protein
MFDAISALCVAGIASCHAQRHFYPHLLNIDQLAFLNWIIVLLEHHGTVSLGTGG